MADWTPAKQEKVLGTNPRITILNTIIDVLNVQDTISLVEEYVKQKEPLHLMGVNADKINELYNKRKSEGYIVKILVPQEHAHLYNTEDVIIVGSVTDGITVAARLYSALRECDDMSAAYIYSESFMDYELGGAIMNRLLKAAGHRVIYV